MDLYTVDSNFAKADPVDVFDSLIWTERYNDAGDVTLLIPDTSDMKAKLVEGTFLFTPASKEIMRIHTASTENGEVTITGKSLVDVFSQRLLRNSWNSTQQSWQLGPGSAGSLANSVIQQMCLPGGLMATGAVVPAAAGAAEVIANLTLATPASGSAITAALEYGNVFDGVKTLCDLDSLGFTLIPTNQALGNGQLTFRTYRGLDRTTSQSTNSPVIFEPALDSLTDVTELRSNAGYMNVAYVWPNGITALSQVVVVYAPGGPFTGFNRRTMMVDASDVTASDYSAANLTAILTQKGMDALANNNYVRMLDGQLVPQFAFIYGTDYNLGDVIELRGSGSTAQKARVTEYIRAQDSTGERAYPTLSVIG